MQAIGFECSGEEFIFAVVDGTQSNVSLVARETRKAPANFERPEVLKWLRREIHSLLDKYKPEVGAYKAAQSMPGRSVGQERCQFEGVVMEAALSHTSKLSLTGLITVQVKKKLNLSKVKGTECLNDLAVEKFPALPKKYFDATLVALSQLEA